MIKENSGLVHELMDAKNMVIEMQGKKIENDAKVKEQINLITFDDTFDQKDGMDF